MCGLTEDSKTKTFRRTVERTTFGRSEREAERKARLGPKNRVPLVLSLQLFCLTCFTLLGGGIALNKLSVLLCINTSILKHASAVGRPISSVASVRLQALLNLLCHATIRSLKRKIYGTVSLELRPPYTIIMRGLRQ